MYKVSIFKTTKAKHQTYPFYLDSKLDIFNIYMPKYTCMNHKMALKDIKLINMLPKIFNLQTKTIYYFITK